MSKNIIFVEHGGINKEFTLKKAKDFGFRIIIATTKPANLIYKYVDHDDVIVTDTFDSNKLVNSVEKFINKKQIKIDAVISFKESSVIPTSFLAEHLKLKGVGSLAAQRSSQNKFNMRTTLKGGGFNSQPNFIKINILDKDFIKDLEKFRKPCVIKPLFGSSSHGVKKIENNENLYKDIEDVKQSMKPEDREIFKNFDGSMLVEEYISGEIISVDGLVIDHKPYIIGTTQFIMGKEPYFQQIGSFIPANIDKKIVEECKKQTCQVIKILGFNTCGFHCEWRIKNDKPYFLEIASRTVGGGILLGYQKVTGIDLLEQLFFALMNEKEKIKIDEKVNKCVLHKSVFPKINKKSTLTKFESFEKIESDKAVWHSIKFASTGDILLSLPETPTQLYYYALEGKDVETLLKKSAEIEKEVFYETKEIE